MKLLIAFMFVLTAISQNFAQVIRDSETFVLVAPMLKEKTRVPVVLPTYFKAEDEKYPLYAIVKEAEPTRYEVQIAFTPNCADEKKCYFGFVSGQEITVKNMPPRGVSVDLAQGRRGYFIDAGCVKDCKRDSTISWDEDGYRYTIGIRNASLERLKTAANSVTGNEVEFRNNYRKRTCFVEIYAHRQNSEARIPNAAAIAVNRDNEIFQSKMRDDISVLTRLPEGEYEITIAKPGFESAVQNFQVKCETNDRELELKVRLGLRGSGEKAQTKTISKRVLNSEAINLPEAQYPAAGIAVKASGEVIVEVLIDENGNVVSAKAVSGHGLLREAAEKAARQAKFKPINLPGQPIRISGIIIYKFFPPKV